MINRIFLSYSEEDQDLAGELSQALCRVGLECQLGSGGSSNLLHRSDRSGFGIRHCDCFVPLLTTSGTLSRTVNQEVGFARALDQLIIPLLEEGADMPFMISHLQPITFSTTSTFEDAIGDLIRLFRDLTRLSWLHIKCPYCQEEMTQYLTPDVEVDKAILQDVNLETVCSYCETVISLDPRTFRPRVDAD